PQRIEMLLSTELFFACLQDGKISLGPGLPCLQNTAFGWIAGGVIEHSTNDSAFICNIAVNAESPKADDILKRFWEIEEFPQSNPVLSEEESYCEKHFLKNVTVLNNGRIQVRLPFKTAPSVLGNSYENAKKRFLLLERRLSRNTELKQMYENFMKEYEDLGHMSRVVDVELSNPHFVIPHHCVMRPESTTTKLRVVFDGSASTSSCKSLNEILMVGATIQQELIITLLSFRLHRFAITADISKMYRQFLVEKDDRKFQLIIWRNKEDEPLQMFELNTVTYGLACSPFLAIRSLFHIADLHSKTHPVGAAIIKRDFYVDDLLTGVDSLSELQQIKSEIIDILSSAGLNLTKWSTNCPQFIESSNEEFFIKTNEECITKMLGMAWKSTTDTICFRYDFPESIPSTKRGILSILARIFDLLGLLSPIVIRGKILLQEMWIKQLKWDEGLPPDLMNRYNQH
ncbi:uncharacterized protein LOC118732860, partial [Rhagoletis pomonella]|uniref:uncharacterized protein LOC118732860 n=1 Tax=Rhagoletis pomonella TaxID=28610 RepID=UPI001785C1B3